MPKIPSYPLAGSVSNDDLMLIDDVSEVYTTKSLKLSTLKGYVNTGQATTTYVDDKVVSGASFNTGTGVLTLTRTDGIDVTEDLDGRYAVTSSLAAVATSGSYNDLSDTPFIPGGTVTSVGLSMPPAFAVIGSPITSAGVFIVGGVGNSLQYIDGTGSLQTFPTIPTNNNQLTNGAGYTTNLGIVQSLTTTGSSGAATLTNGVLNIPQYSGGGGGVTSIIAGTGIGIDQSTGDVTITNTGSATGSYATLTRTFTGSELVNAFNGVLGEEIVLVTVPAGYQAIISGDAIQYVDYNTGTTDYTGPSLSLRISNLINYIVLSSTVFTNSSFPFYMTNGQTDTNNTLGTSDLGSNIVLTSNSAVQKANFTAGDRDVTISFTYRLINLNL